MIDKLEYEEDRAAYIQIMELINRVFMESVQAHEKENHAYGRCFKELLDDMREKTLDRLKDYPKKEHPTVIEEWIEHNVDQMIVHISVLITLSQLHNEKQVKH